MPKLLIGNFDFEYQLEFAARRATLERINAELSWHLTALADFSQKDVLLAPAVPLPSFVLAWDEFIGAAVRIITKSATGNADLVACPWGWSNSVRVDCQLNQWQVIAPAQGAVTHANSRQWSFETEQRLGLTLPGAAPIGSQAEFQDAVHAASRLSERALNDQKWVVKADFGMSGRERVFGRGLTLPENTQRWIDQRFATGHWLIFEPWLERIQEFGVLFEIHPPEQSSPVKLVAVTELLTDQTGRYVGTFLRSEPLVELEIEPIREFVQAVADSGYWGPIGIDAMRYRDSSGRECVRPIQDVNARWTMGFVANALKQRFAAQASVAAWIHISTERLSELVSMPITENLEAQLKNAGRSPLLLPVKNFPNVTALRTSPAWLNTGRLRHVGVLIWGDVERDVRRAMEEMLGQ